VPVAETLAARLKAIGHPLRMRMGMLMLEAPRTVKALAAALEVPQTRLYHHIRILEDNGLVEVSDRRLVSGIEERTYRGIEGNWALNDEILESSPEVAAVLDALFAMVRAEIDIALDAEPERGVGANDAAVPILSFTELDLTFDELDDLRNRLGEVMQQYGMGRSDAPPDAIRYHALFAAYKEPRGTDAA
jgi:DNA-binding transcriptional ArsR family regulator